MTIPARMIPDVSRETSRAVSLVVSAGVLLNPRGEGPPSRCGAARRTAPPEGGPCGSLKRSAHSS